jgi:uncharacterized protein
VIRPILEGAWRRYRVSAAEVGLQDKWQRSLLGMACVSENGGHAREVLSNVERFVWSFPEIEVLNAAQTTFAWSD